MPDTPSQRFALAESSFPLGIVPLAMTRADAPEAPRNVSLRLSRLLDLSPISVAATLTAGAANGAAFALAPIYALGIGVKPSAAPLFTVAIVFASAVGVYPAGLALGSHRSAGYSGFGDDGGRCVRGRAGEP